MTNDEIRDALIAACEGSAFVDVADEGAFILDGAFTLQQLVAIGDVARKAREAQPPQSGLFGSANLTGQGSAFLGGFANLAGEVIR